MSNPSSVPNSSSFLWGRTGALPFPFDAAAFENACCTTPLGCMGFFPAGDIARSGPGATLGDIARSFAFGVGPGCCAGVF